MFILFSQLLEINTVLSAFGGFALDTIQLGLMWSLLALGVFITYRVLDVADLTVESSIVTGGAVMILCSNFQIPYFFGFLFGFLAGCLAGAITGILHIYLKIPAILSGIIVMTGLVSINMHIMAIAKKIGGTVGNVHLDVAEDTGLEFSLSNWMSNSFLGNLGPFVLTLLIVAFVFLLLYWFFGTEFGMSLRSTGNNQAMSRAQGINTSLRIIIGLAISNGLVALCGALIADSSFSMGIDKGRGTIVVGLVSIVIGEAIFGRGSFKKSLLSVIVGSIVYQLLYNIAITYLQFDPNDLKIVASILIVLVLLVPMISKKTVRSQKLKALENTIELPDSTNDREVK